MLLIKFLLCVECVVDNNGSGSLIGGGSASVGASCMVLNIENGVLVLCLLSLLMCAKR